MRIPVRMLTAARVLVGERAVVSGQLVRRVIRLRLDGGRHLLLHDGDADLLGSVEYGAARRALRPAPRLEVSWKHVFDAPHMGHPWNDGGLARARTPSRQ